MDSVNIIILNIYWNTLLVRIYSYYPIGWSYIGSAYIFRYGIKLQINTDSVHIIFFYNFIETPSFLISKSSKSKLSLDWGGGGSYLGTAFSSRYLDLASTLGWMSTMFLLKHIPSSSLFCPLPPPNLLQLHTFWG